MPYEDSLIIKIYLMVLVDSAFNAASLRFGWYVLLAQWRLPLIRRCLRCGAWASIKSGRFLGDVLKWWKSERVISLDNNLNFALHQGAERNTSPMLMAWKQVSWHLEGSAFTLHFVLMLVEIDLPCPRYVWSWEQKQWLLISQEADQCNVAASDAHTAEAGWNILAIAVNYLFMFFWFAGG